MLYGNYTDPCAYSWGRKKNRTKDFNVKRKETGKQLSVLYLQLQITWCILFPLIVDEKLKFCRAISKRYTLAFIVSKKRTHWSVQELWPVAQNLRETCLDFRLPHTGTYTYYAPFRCIKKANCLHCQLLLCRVMCKFVALK